MSHSPSPSRANGTYGSRENLTSIEEPQSTSELGQFISRFIGTDAQTVDSIASALGHWSPDMFKVAIDTAERPLLVTSMILLDHLNIRSGLEKMEDMKLVNFINSIEKGYHKSNPYHNSIHGADVLQNMTYLLSTSFLDEQLPALWKLACWCAAMIHDVDHPGVTNAFLIAAKSELAIRYNDKAVLENHHCCFAFTQLVKEENNFTCNLSVEEFKEFRKIVIDLVLATDLQQHFDLVGSLRTRMASKSINVNNNDDLMLHLKLAIKVSDLGHCAKHVGIHQNWTGRIMEEFFMQGDREKAAGLPISAFMDRETTVKAKSQRGFFDFLVQPLFSVWVDAVPDHMHILELLKENRGRYGDG